MKNMLLEFLDAGQLAIGSEDEKLALLELAASDLRSQLETNPGMIPRATLAALDSNLPTTDPVYALASAATTARWKTIFNKQGAAPVQVYRALLLSALQSLAASDDRVRKAILAISDSVPVDAFGQGEATPIRAFLEHLRSIEHEQDEKTWVALPELRVLDSNVKPRKFINKADLGLAMARAVGPTNKARQALEGANTEWPNSGEVWAHTFAEKASDAISTAISNSHKLMNDEVVAMQRETLSRIMDTFNKLSIRDAKTELLWLKESAYSPSANLRLNLLTSGKAVIYPVLDVSRIAGATMTQSLKWFLNDLVNAISADEHDVLELLSEVGAVLRAEPEAKYLEASGLPPSGRRTLLEIALMPEAGADLLSQSGLANESKETLPRLAMHLLREMQALKILLA